MIKKQGNKVRKAFSSKTKEHKPAAYTLGLALQGGGSYGAFTKGALKALLEDGIITAKNLKAVSGTSAGAKNATLLVDGLTSGTTGSTASKLDEYWDDIGRTWNANKKSPFPLLNLFIPPDVTKQSYPNLTAAFQHAAALVTPPSGYMYSELRRYLNNHVSNWSALQTSPIKLFVNTVKENPRTGARAHHVFTGNTLSADTVPLSANLRNFGPAKHDQSHYFDGAYWRNPCFDDLTKSGISDLLVITLQAAPDRPVMPRHQDDARNAQNNPGDKVLTAEIHDHMAWLANNKPALNLHEIRLDVQPHWDDSSRMNANPIWLDDLSDKGYKAAKQWIKDNRHLLGTASSYKKTHHASNDNQTSPDPQKRRQPA